MPPPLLAIEPGEALRAQEMLDLSSGQTDLVRAGHDDHTIDDRVAIEDADGRSPGTASRTGDPSAPGPSWGARRPPRRSCPGPRGSGRSGPGGRRRPTSAVAARSMPSLSHCPAGRAPAISWLPRARAGTRRVPADWTSPQGLLVPVYLSPRGGQRENLSPCSGLCLYEWYMRNRGTEPVPTRGRKLHPSKTSPVATQPKPAVSAVEMGARQREISVSEFFTKNRHLLGFDNPRKALLTCVKEADRKSTRLNSSHTVN